MTTGPYQVLTFNGATFNFPLPSATNWGSVVSAWAAAINNGVLTKSGGLFQLLAQLDFGANYGIVAINFNSRNNDIATSGIVNLAQSDSIAWRNDANTGDNKLSTNTLNQLTFNGVVLQGGGVTSIALTGANGIGISGSPIVTNGTIALSLGTITPLVANITGTLSASNFNGIFSGSSSGTNTGDQYPGTGLTLTSGSFNVTVDGSTITNTGTLSIGTVYTANINANAVTYAKLQTEGTQTLLGNPGTTSVVPSEIKLGSTLSFVGTVLETNAFSGDFTSGTNSFAGTLNTVNSNVGTFSALTVNGKGLVTAAANLTASGDVTGTASNTNIALTLGSVNSNTGTFTAVTVGSKGLVTAATNLVVSGDVTGTASGTSIALTLGTSGATAGTYGNGSAIPVVTVNAKGLVTNISTSAITYGTGSVTSVATGTGLTGGPVTTTGTISMGTSGVTAGTYAFGNFTVDALGRITQATAGTPVTSIVAGTGLSGGTITSTGTISIGTSGVTAGTYGTNNTNFAIITVNALGQVTAASTGTFTAGTGSVTSVATGTGLTGGPVTTTGTISIGTSGVTAGTYEGLVINALGQVTSASVSVTGCGQFQYTNGSTVTLAPFNGNLIQFPGGSTANIGTGITSTITSCYLNGTSGKSLSASTLYYSYLYSPSAGTYVIDWSTTGSAVDTTGIQIKSGDNTRVLVGMAYVTSGTAFADSGANRLVASWYNRKPKSAVGTFSTTRNTSGTALAEINPEVRASFLTWGDGADFALSQIVTNNSAGFAQTVIYLDSATAVCSGGANTSSSNQNWNSSLAAFADVTTIGSHYATIYGSIGNGSATYQGGNFYPLSVKVII